MFYYISGTRSDGIWSVAVVYKVSKYEYGNEIKAKNDLEEDFYKLMNISCDWDVIIVLHELYSNY